MPRLTRADFTDEERLTMSRIMRRANERAGNGTGAGRRRGKGGGGRGTEKARRRDRRTAGSERRGPGGRFV